MFNFIEELFDTFKGIGSDTADLIDGIITDTIQYKNEMIQLYKDEVPIIGNSAEKIDRLITTVINIADQLPSPFPGPTHNDFHLIKLLIEATKVKQVVYNDAEIAPAQHLKVNRLGYSHHALSLDEYEVFHYQNGIIKIDSLKEFAKGSPIHILNTPRIYSVDEVLERAYSRLFEKNYNLLFNNCEHFVRWAMNGGK